MSRFLTLLLAVLIPAVTWCQEDRDARNITRGRQQIFSTAAGEVRMFNEQLDLKMVWCPAGRFTMGSPPGEKDRSGDEDQVQVTLTKGFWLARTEVTQGQWQAVMGTEPWKDQTYRREGANYPATYVSWEDAIKFCDALTTRERPCRGHQTRECMALV